MTIFNVIIGNMVSKVTGKVISSESISKDKSMVEILVADCSAVSGGPQVQNETSD